MWKTFIIIFIIMSSIRQSYSLMFSRLFVHGRIPVRAFASASAAANVPNNSPLPTAAPQNLQELRQIRINKGERLKEVGVNPYAYNFHSTHSSVQLQHLYENLGKGQELQDVTAAIAGRIMARRVFGKLAFFEIVDDQGSIQAYLDKGTLAADEFNRIRDLTDVGDIIGVQGSIKRTDRGELSINVKSWVMLTKSLLPLPDKFHGLTDINKRYRYRHIDMITNPETIKTFKARAFIISSIRKMLDSKGFLEVETPILTAQPGGADAKPFETHHKALDMELTLRIATELHLKRLIVGGLPRVYEIGRIFRNEGLSPRHNPEFTSIELYQSYADYTDMMNLTETMVSNIAANLNNGSMSVPYGQHEINLTPPWRRIAMSDLVKKDTGFDIAPFVKNDEFDACKQEAIAHGLPASLFESCNCVGDIMNAIFETLESSLIQPTFVTDYPLSISPLAKPHRTNPHLTERFELFITGKEVANAFSELTDPLDQRRRFQEQLRKQSENLNGRRETIDEEFLQALEIGMPPTAGLGIGIDRLVMILTNSSSIKDVIAFPLLRKEE